MSREKNNQKNDDLVHNYMRKALKYAQQAADCQEVPIGAVVVAADGTIIGHGFNRTEALGSQIEHAEVRAIRAACKKIGDWRLEKATLYVTLEPCMMCISLVSLSRIETVVYGAASPLFGYSLDSESLRGVYTKHIKRIVPHILAEESALLLQNFFKNQRKSL